MKQVACKIKGFVYTEGSRSNAHDAGSGVQVVKVPEKKADTLNTDEQGTSD